MSAEVHLDSNSNHIKTVFYAGANYEWRIELRANPKARCSPRAAMPELECYQRFEVVLFKHSLARGAEALKHRMPSEMGLSRWGYSWSLDDKKALYMPLELALEFVQAAQALHSPLYWRLPEAAPGCPITTRRGEDGCHEETRIRLSEEYSFVIATHEGLSHPRRRCRTLDEFTEVVVSVETPDGETFALGDFCADLRHRVVLPGSVGHRYLMGASTVLSVLTSLAKCFR